MDSKERAMLIREANTAFNDGDFPKARKLYLQTEYKDGLIRMGDYYMYERKLPVLAFGYYKKAGHTQKVEEIFQRMIWALGQWIGMDKIKVVHKDKFIPAMPVTPDDFRIHPILRNTALEILNRNKA